VIFRRLYARVRALDPLRADFALALLITPMAVAEALLGTAEGDRLVTVLAAVGALLFPITWRRRDPVLAVVVFGVVLVVEQPLDGFLMENVEAAFVGMLLLFYSLGRHCDGRRLWIGAAMAVGLAACSLLLAGHEGYDEIFWVLLLVTPPILAGRALRSRTRLQAELREKARQAEAARHAAVEIAADEERERIAAELQVKVADAVSAIVVQAETVRGSVESGATQRAEDAFASIEATGRDALAEMRSLLGVLRHDGDGVELAPQPGLGRLQALVERVRGQGIDVELVVTGDERTPAAGVDLTAYRVIQDALEAAVEQGASRAQVDLSYGERELRVAVRDDRTGGASHRLPGLRERVGLYGGHLRAGRQNGGGFTLESTLPLSEAGT
jgi:signal transduction histidine kinase